MRRDDGSATSSCNRLAEFASTVNDSSEVEVQRPSSAASASASPTIRETTPCREQAGKGKNSRGKGGSAVPSQYRVNLLTPTHRCGPLTRNILANKITPAELEQQLRHTFFPPPTDTPTHTKPFSPPLDPSHMDGSFPLNELKRALDSLQENTSPGEDQITYQLWNLDDAQLQQLLDYFNRVWQTVDTPAEWKHDTVTMIHKPNIAPK
ncbi:hypothetical protein HPB47_009987 [Ixodes persulcatus]|uniref:Uncharacterized protein n=1 Tax=Ixodes persulcatus TaxID=34615 RepID=A0AC60P0F8_IXOPE|nr:hypothetical protein HPB47_009987 [Ixodes persulcatus]